jgi:hypothetical protein
LRGGSTSEAVVFVIHSPQGIPTFPSVVVRVWPAHDDDGKLYIVSAPTLTEDAQLERPMPELGRWFAQAIGPLETLRQSTIDEAVTFTQSVARRFVSVAESYISILDRGGDVADGTEWDTFEADLDAERPTVTGRVDQDTTAPDLCSLEFLPDTIQAGSAARCRVRLTDGGSGVNGGAPQSYARLTSPSGGQTKTFFFGTPQRISGDTFDGTYEEEQAFDQAAERGHWSISEIVTVDIAGNHRRYEARELRSRGLPTVLHVR